MAWLPKYLHIKTMPFLTKNIITDICAPALHAIPFKSFFSFFNVYPIKSYCALLKFLEFFCTPGLYSSKVWSKAELKESVQNTYKGNSKSYRKNNLSASVLQNL